MPEPTKIEALELEIAQLQAEARTQVAAEQYLRTQLAQALRTVELAKKQLLLLEMQQLEIQSLRNQVSSLNHQLAFSQEREERLEQKLRASEQTLASERQERTVPGATWSGNSPALPAFLRKPLVAATGEEPGESDR
ncbi:hypothetical protein [Gloeobacter kilaueensis]|uniref:Uncharacterized protein n=1 Tax=Gloeobacter kilaueensis (strain ATCC BAA-2537 / CCAP 1431/1 / ULC 316 / JS1) TaxID=1183438 RepID=U5QSC1_GLOK1|nr:hypothetical protein [Gloeobacter kilaueensis]AGY60554.1 hypothetical protein GKIL_4308 [Gloeobacter kilaueensis JS1]